jgi:hypothetical protein
MTSGRAGSPRAEAQPVLLCFKSLEELRLSDSVTEAMNAAGIKPWWP